MKPKELKLEESDTGTAVYADGVWLGGTIRRGPGGEVAALRNAAANLFRLSEVCAKRADKLTEKAKRRR